MGDNMHRHNFYLTNSVPSEQFLRETRDSGGGRAGGDLGSHFDPSAMNEVGQINYKKKSNFILKGSSITL